MNFTTLTFSTLTEDCARLRGHSTLWVLFQVLFMIDKTRRVVLTLSMSLTFYGFSVSRDLSLKTEIRQFGVSRTEGLKWPKLYPLKSILASWKSSIKLWIFISWRAGLSYLEVALLIRQSGGTYSYWYEAYGRIPAFLICWFWSVIGKSQKKALQ